jgi:hypothetical protein
MTSTQATTTLHDHYANNALACGHAPTCQKVTLERNWPTIVSHPVCDCGHGEIWSRTTFHQLRQATGAKKATAPIMELGADLSPAVAAIEKAYRMFQKAYADAPAVTIVVKRDSKAWGHTTVAKVWAPAATEAAADRFEIMISGENLRRGADHVAATLLHEAAHARNLNKGILDTDTTGRHNKIFKATAEEHGLSCECAGWHGWTVTALTDDGRKRWSQMIALISRGLAKSAATAMPSVDHLPVAPTVEGGSPVAPPVGKGGVRIAPPRRGNHNLIKAVCECGYSIRASKGVLDKAAPVCSECHSAFVAS